MSNNKITYGLSQLYYSIITETDSTVTYAAPVAMPGAVNMTCAPRGDVMEFEADNIVYYRSRANDGYDISLEIAELPVTFLEDVMLEELDANGVLFEKNDTEPKKIAILGQFEGDVKAKRFVFYNCMPSRANFDGETSKSKTPKTKTITMTADPRADGYVKASTTTEVNATAYSSWFTSVNATPAATAATASTGSE